MFEQTLNLKFLMVGDSGVGKTTIVHALRGDVFRDESEPTLGVEFNTFPMEMEGKPFNLQIWDTAGQEAYRALSQFYYRDGVGVFLVFSFDIQQSFLNVNSWINDVRRLCNPKAKIFLVGNKVDLTDQRQVTKNEVEQFAKEHNVEYWETSAKTKYNIKELVLHAAFETYRAILTGEIERPVTKYSNQTYQAEKESCC